MVVGIQGGHEGVNIQAQLLRQLGQCLRHSAFKHGRHEAAYGFGIRDGVTNLTRLLRHQAAPNGITLGPKIFAFVVEAFGILVHHHTQGNAIDSGTNAAVVQRRTRINGHHVGLRGVADLVSTFVKQMLEQSALVEFGAANEEVVRRKFALRVLTPCLFQPRNVGFKTTRRHDTGFGRDALGAQDLALR